MLDDDELNEECNRVLERLGDESDLDGYSSDENVIEIVSEKPQRKRVGVHKLTPAQENEVQEFLDENHQLRKSNRLQKKIIQEAKLPESFEAVSTQENEEQQETQTDDSFFGFIPTVIQKTAISWNKKKHDNIPFI